MQGCELIIHQPIGYLTIDPFPVDSGFEIDKDLKVGNHPLAAAELAGPLASAAGTLDNYQLVNNPTFAYVSSAWAKGTIDEANADAKLRIFITKVELLMLGLWMIKDNSVNPLRAYLRVDDSEGPHFRAHVSTNQFYSAAGKLDTVHFTKGEFEQSVAFYRQIWDLLPKRPENERQATALVLGGRLSRTLYLVQAARSSADLLIRIAFCCMCLEALFSTDNAGIAHRISERAAMFIGEDGTEKRTIYTEMHRLYRTRSAVVHGSPVKESRVPALTAAMVRCDDYLRRCLTKILVDRALLDLFEHKDPKAIDVYFLDHLFPEPPPATAGGTTAT